MASLIHEADRPRLPWRVDWTERRRRRTRRFRTRREAQIFIGDVERGERASGRERITLTDWITTWVTEAGLTWEPRTRKDRARYADRFIVPELGAMRLHEIDRGDIRAWRAALLRKPYSASPYTADRALSVLSAALGEAVREGLIRTNPCREMGKLPRAVQRRQPATLAQVEQIRTHLERPADRAMVSLMAYAGLRPSEARALRSSDVGQKTLVVRAAISSEGAEKRTKTGNVRSVPVIEALRDDLVGLLADDEGEVANSIGDDRRSLLGPVLEHRTWTKRVWNPARLAAGVGPVTPYQLRHTFASLLIAEGRNAWQVAALMGHANPQMVITVYGHLFADAELSERVPMEEAAKHARHEAASVLRRASVTGPGERSG